MQTTHEALAFQPKYVMGIPVCGCRRHLAGFMRGRDPSAYRHVRSDISCVRHTDGGPPRYGHARSNAYGDGGTNSDRDSNPFSRSYGNAHTHAD